MGCLKHKYLFLLCIIGLVACTYQPGPLVPVTEAHWQMQKFHRVLRGETLYAVAFHYDLDYRKLAKLNNLKPPYILYVGQVLKLTSTAKKITPYLPRKVQHSALWYWPLHGRVVTSFSPANSQKGINIAGVKGQTVHAAASGVVAYAGSGLSGYGKLILIKHAHQYLTAYGNNSASLVKEGQVVRANQAIGVIGIVDNRYFGSHFEIRLAGHPVNPLLMLNKF